MVIIRWEKLSSFWLRIKRRIHKLASKFDNSYKKYTQSRFWLRWDLIAVTIAINILGLAIPILMLQLYDRIIPTQGVNTLAILSAGVGVALVANFILESVRQYLINWTSARYEYFTTLDAFKHFLGAKILAFEKKSPNLRLEQIESISKLRDQQSGQDLVSLLDLPFGFLFLFIIGYLAGPIMVAVTIVAVVMTILALLIGQQIEHFSERRHHADEQKYSFILEVFKNFYTVKTFGLEEQFLRRHERIHLKGSRLNLELNRYLGALQTNGSSFSQIMVMAVICVGSFLVIDNKLSTGALIACSILAGRVISPVNKSVAVLIKIKKLNAVKQSFADLFTLPQEELSFEAHTDLDKKSLKQIQRIQFKNINFGYDTNQIVLKNLEFDADKGQIVALKGNIGSGRSSFFQLILRMVEPTNGKILINHKPIESFDLNQVRKLIRYVPKELSLFYGTLFENLTMFDKTATLDHVENILNQLDLDTWLHRLPDGLQTIMNERSFEYLPVGIQQRISIARAFISNPEVILFDEVSSGIDDQGRKILTQMLMREKTNKIIIFAGEHLDLEDIVDKRYLLENGHLSQIKEEATHEQ